MDLGFARRHRANKAQDSHVLDLDSLLSQIAARQALSPTARVCAEQSAHDDRLTSAHPEIERFAPRADRKVIGNAVSSFSPEVARAIHTPYKSI